jgi:hypothetical protein
MQTLEIEIEQLLLQSPLTTSGQSLLAVELILPRPGIAQKTAVKSVALRRGKASFQKKPFYQSGLLKEKVEGRFGLRLQLTRPLAHPALARWLEILAATGVEGLGEFLSAGLQPSALRGLVEAPFEEWADALLDDEADFLLSGGIDLDSAAPIPKQLTIPLQLNRTLRTASLPPGPKSREQRKPQSKTYKKGLTLGEAVLRVRA